MIGNISLENFEFTSTMWYVLVPLILCTLDVITGYINAWVHNYVKSAKMRTGLGKKCGELAYAIVGVVAKYALGTSSVAIFVTGYICIMELVSLAENCDKLGVPLPEKIKNKLNNLEEVSIDENK